LSTPTDRWRIFSSGRTRPAIHPWRVNRDADITPDQIPALLDGAEIIIIDHTPLPTEVARRCNGLKHVVFLGTGARSYMNPEELGDLGIEVHLNQGLWRHRGRRMRDRADVGRRRAALREWTARCAPATGCARTGMQLTGKTLGLIGFGGIAAEVARIGLGSGMRVIAWNRSPKKLPASISSRSMRC